MVCFQLNSYILSLQAYPFLPKDTGNEAPSAPCIFFLPWSLMHPTIVLNVISYPGSGDEH